jgi:hypothetical protein
MPSWNSVHGAEGLNGFGTQSHPNVESRPSGCDERAIYEEALQVYNVWFVDTHCKDHI